MKKRIALLGLITGLGMGAAAQHQHAMPGMNDSSAASDKMAGMKMDMPMPPMSHALSLNLAMSRDGSGTSWLPDASPMYAYMIHAKRWMYMFHGNIFIRYDRQDIGRAGSRGGEKWDAPNMIMGMAQTQIGDKGILHISTMFSLDAVVAGGSGYPLLFQTGESWKGQPLVDRQHPHDLFSELSASYAYSFTPRTDLYLYVAYPGEPALGPVTFMHRPSGMDNPDAPLGHHWTDATHITFGVATMGLRYGKFKIEGSSFTGREPDENRYNFDKPLFNSWSGRLSVNPNTHWALQVSHGLIKSPEALRPNEDVRRTTASASYGYSFGMERNLSATAVWGMNQIKTQDASHDVQVEGSLRLGRSVTYLRDEWVQKSVEELDLDPSVYGADIQFPAQSLTLGAGYDLLHNGPVRIMVGGQFTWYHADSRLASLYGRDPLAGELYVRIYPPWMNM